MATNPAEQGKDEVAALARGLALLRVVAAADQPLSNRELADNTGIPKATVSRLTATLQGSGFLTQSPSSERFSLGPGVLDLGNAFLRHFDFRLHARPQLAELAEAAGANVHLAVRDGLDVLLIDTLRPKTALVLSRMDVGSRMAIATSAAGRAYLAASPDAERSELLQELRTQAGKGATKVMKAIDAALAEYARHGFCSSFGEWHPEIHALGFALHGPRGELYAVSVGGPAYKLPQRMLLEKVGPRLLQVQRAIERGLGRG